jgi:hypothetical protein
MSTRKPVAGRSDPYCAFVDDRERRLALMSRDIRLVLIAFVGLVSASSAKAWPALLGLIVGG